MNRRRFLRQSAALGALSALGLRARAAAPHVSIQTTPAPLLDLRALPPVPIRRIELLGDEALTLLRVTTTDGAQGHMAVNRQLLLTRDVFVNLVAPFFIGRDARDMESLIDAVYAEERNYKFSGMPFWNAVGHIELALLDLLARARGVPVWALVRPEPLRRRVPVYLSTFEREASAEATLAAIEEQLGDTGITALKLKVGGRMGRPGPPGRDEALIRAARRRFPTPFTLYADANSSFDFDRAVAVGRLLQKAKFDIYEEPVWWEDAALTRRVAQALAPLGGPRLAGGEQDTSWPRWQALAADRTLAVLQPDLFYNGGFLRCLRVAQLAAQHGLGFAPHSPHDALRQAPLLHLIAVAPVAEPFQEYNPEVTPLREWCWTLLHPDDGALAVPTDPGWGITLDPYRLADAPVRWALGD